VGSPGFAAMHHEAQVENGLSQERFLARKSESFHYQEW